MKNTVVHCPTEELAVKVLKKANSEGFCWSGGGNFTRANNHWKHYSNLTVYSLYNGVYGCVKFYEEKGGEVISAEEYLNMSINLDKYTPKGEIADIPKPIIKRMLEEQKEQGNDIDISVFENRKDVAKSEGGFDWILSKEGNGFWIKVIKYKLYDSFFEKYNQLADMTAYPMEMWVWNDDVRDASLKKVEGYVKTLEYPYLIKYENSNHNYFGFKNASLKNPNSKSQKEILKEIQDSGFNIVTCGNCWGVILMDKPMKDSKIIECPHCIREMEHSDLPDLC
ncbi:hypothetical protein PG616_01015 [Riemerella anatipestifer]|nr:hypothetical protein [Riemerella anatipestifer]